MKYLFATLAAILICCSFVLYWSYPDVATEVPVLYWVTDPNPARVKQVDLFHQWLKKHGHVTTDGQPVCELRLDSANNDQSKKVIQGVSGVAGDTWDSYGGGMLRYFRAIGLLTDVTEDARRMGFGLDVTWPAVEAELAVDGRQYAFPCNVATTMMWVNKATFAKFGQPLPPMRWTFEEFERMGKAYVAAANPPGKRQEYFYAAYLNSDWLYRSMGVSMYNETMTRCALDDARYVEFLRLLHKWTYEDHILPSAADRAAFDTASGYAGSTLQLFNQGNYAMFPMGRYALIQLRKFGALQLAVVEVPHGGIPMAPASARAATVYVAGRHRELAKLFLAYLASADYNTQIVDDADALPPNPVYADTEAFRRPPDYPNEWEVHELFVRTIRTIAVETSYSPYVLHTVATRHQNDATDAVMSGRKSPQDAARQARERINLEIDRSVAESPELAQRYAKDVQIQKQIDARRAAGQKAPRAWIADPLHLRVYELNGWLEDAAPAPEARR